MVKTLMASLLHCAIRDISLSLRRFRLVLNTITNVKSLTWLLPRGFLMKAHPFIHLHRLEGTELMESSHNVCHLAYFIVSHVDDKFCGDLCYDSESDRIHYWVFVGTFLGAISSNKVCFPRTLSSCSSLPFFSPPFLKLKRHLRIYPSFSLGANEFFKMNLFFGYFIHADNMLQPHSSFHCLCLFPNPPLPTVSFSPPAQSLVSIPLSDVFGFVLWHTRFNKGQLCGHGWGAIY